MQLILVSACLLGERVRYDGGCKSVHDPLLERWLREGRCLPFCPEVAGGLPVPRPPAELQYGDVARVLRGDGVVHRADGHLVTNAFLRGAEQALACCRRHGVRMAILKERSPSCAIHEVYDGTFAARRVAGMGVTARLLLQHGVQLFNETSLQDAAAYLALLEGSRIA